VLLPAQLDAAEIEAQMIGVFGRQRQVTLAQQRAQVFARLPAVGFDQPDAGEDQGRRETFVRTRVYFVVQRVTQGVDGVHRAQEQLRPPGLA